MKCRQLSFGNSENEFKKYWRSSGKKTHGGSEALGKRKVARPLDSKKPLHLILKSETAVGIWSLRHREHRTKVDKTVFRYAKRFGITVFKYSNNGTHLHISLEFSSRKSFQSFLRTIAGIIARIVMGAKKGAKRSKFWSQLAFTRVANWGKELQTLNLYIFRNEMEAAGIVKYDRKHIPLSFFESS